jgi:hypothetical protein
VIASLPNGDDVFALARYLMRNAADAEESLPAVAPSLLDCTTGTTRVWHSPGPTMPR